MDSKLLTQVQDHLRAKDFEVPTLPAVATQALALANDENTTSQQLANLLCKDQSMATSLLRLANSPAFGGRAQVVSLQQAITRLGMKTIAELAVTICVKGNVFPSRRFKALAHRMWSHALASALYAKEVARQQRHNVESAYLCGLLHRVGMPIVLKAVGELFKKNPPSDEEAYAIAEALHVEAGLMAVDRWKLPAQVAASIESCDHYEEADEHRKLAALVHLASALSTELLNRSDEEEVDDPVPDLPVLEELSIYPDHLQSIRKHEETISMAVAV